MSEISTEKDIAWYPAQFPAQGRLPTQAALVGKNCHQQDSQERAYRQELCLAADRRVEPPCCNTLHISLFFDGTGNNLNNDQYLSDPKHPTNIARLFRATIGTGYAGGAEKEPLDSSDSISKKYFKYYIPGVGTPFPEINDLEYSMTGLAGARYGEDRINWGLLRLIDALMRTMGMGKLDDSACLLAIKGMNTSWASLGFGGSHNRYEEFSKQLKQLESKLRTALAPAEPGKPKLLGIKLYVYGFSRGAAEARAFVRWLSELLPKPEAEGLQPEQCLAINDLKIPLSVEFLGLLDTVASVGIAHVAPVAEGHMAWADGTQELPDEATYGGFIKRCVHLISSNEQRLCFPLDSIRHTDGKYPSNSVEVVYPGMHSDLGGGYPPGDQGKANEKHDGILLSQIALHEMYAAAFAVGAPLKVPKEAVPKNLSQDDWRGMPFDLGKQFVVAPDLINRFNAWREVTLNLPPATQELTAEQAAQFEPVRASVTLEKAVNNQMGWITAWRINRYAGDTLKKTRFYLDATDKDKYPADRKASQAKRDADQAKIERERKDQLAKQREGEPSKPLPPGVKDFDPDIAQTQLAEAAQEFGHDYRGESRSLTSTWQLVLDKIPQTAIFLINTDDERAEFKRMKADGDAHVKVLFPPQGEASNAEQPSGLLRDLYDDQVHDSRAWFLHATFGSREPWGGYFRDRMVYFGDNCNKELSLLTIAGNVVGVATLVGGVIFSFKQKKLAGKLSGLAGTASVMALEAKALDLITGEPLPMLPEADLLTAFTQVPGAVASLQKELLGEQQLEQAKTMIASRWAQAESLLTS
ncbi:T6SS phospholipase effector Tle1-like catalytic domain-containing protein [Yersinia sp. 2553 StPb PI]|uniref:T6SS phospholipase effector Tle1-like catalytic domain-containing protein n=2 Tax=Yersiniaceae TaxID=1903411 RepID=UPI0005DACB56|nr:DUF2235 domain-containing protein [Yersinia enterocolitica]PNM26338.1 hypothetical protein A6J66_020550 [Yersinia enterocolitica]CNM02363.1 Uncharacterized conserved protein [Yersinia intermedia]CQQ72437.1 Uncharacterized conserved protein [Yersinia enterocolitica]HEI6952641.1 DUF2235 domain-containing protein [Yersinia enterocolitica]